MRREILLGSVAGAVGTVALNITTYLDMALRGRPPSSVPSQIVATLAERVGVDLSGGRSAQSDSTKEEARHRRSGLGALQGYLVGLGIGTAYGLLRARLASVPMPLAGVGLGLTAMAASDLPATTLGVTDPRTWGAPGWAADIVPHLAYGVCAALTYEALFEQ